MMAPDISSDVSGVIILSCNPRSVADLAVTLLNSDFKVTNIESFPAHIDVFKALRHKGLNGSKALH